MNHIDNAISEIMNRKPHKIRKEWLKEKNDSSFKSDLIKTDKEILDQKNLRISYSIDRINEKIKG